jgi:hypothetical protein
MVARTELSKLKSCADSFERVSQVKKPTYLSAQLRESAPYLRDAGWGQTATLLLAAADEIETLRQRLGTNAEALLNQQVGHTEPAPKVAHFPPSLPTAKQA